MKNFFIALFLALTLLALSSGLLDSPELRAEYVEQQIGTWFALSDDTDPQRPKTAFVAKSSFTRHVTKVALDEATLHIGCEGLENFIFFDFDVPVKSVKGQKFNAQYQFDEGKFNNANWRLTANTKALMVPNPEIFVRNLLKAKLLLVKVEKADDSGPIESYFNVSDLSESFDFVKKNCQWK
ncbi:MAG: hypothetical protein LBF38_02695 [Deltaproteobacteria bacterium]|jgi:hypothetical protein|nr:hypothetical protein [Deltaproteobacteria bacterium]